MILFGTASPARNGNRTAEWLRVVETAGVVGIAGCSPSEGTEPDEGTETAEQGKTPGSGPTGEALYQYDAANSGHAPGESRPRSDAEVLWSFRTEDGGSTAPAVVNGTVYVGGGFDSFVYAIDADDGTEQWRFETDGDVEGSPTVVDGVVYVAGTGDRLYALEAEDGTERWSADTGNYINAAVPAVADGIVYAGTDGGKVFAFNAAQEIDSGRSRRPTTSGRRQQSSTGRSMPGTTTATFTR